MKNKFISTTLPYINSVPHIGHCFEFVLADVIAEYHRLNQSTVIFNVGIDEHGQKVEKKALELGYTSTQKYCDELAENWLSFCNLLKINYDNFYRTTNSVHKERVLRFYDTIQPFINSKDYVGKYCLGCESYITEKELVWGRCSIHNSELVLISENNKFFNLVEFAARIKNVLVDKSKSKELRNIVGDSTELSITRKNVTWGIPTGEEGEVFYVWFEALLNYIFALEEHTISKFHFDAFWENSTIICGKDNLKFQAFILQALLLAGGYPQTKEVLVHGNILDSNGIKLSKSIGNIIDPVEQVYKYGVDAVRYYLVFGLNTFEDSKYSESDLVNKWNNDIVNGLGNLISRLLHLIELRNVVLDESSLDGLTNDKISEFKDFANAAFNGYHFKDADTILNGLIFNLNRRITLEKPFDKSCENYSQILNEIYFQLKVAIPYFGLILKEHKPKLDLAFRENKKAIIFKKM